MVILILMVMLFQINSKIAIGDRVVYDDKFVTLTGSFDVTVEEGATLLNHYHNIDYPSGFNRYNTVVVAIGLDRLGNGFSFGTLSEDRATAYQMSAIGKSVQANNDHLTLALYFNYAAPHSAADYTFEYKITLMKIDPDVSDYELGDINMDGQVTQADLDLLYSYLRNEISFTDKQFKLADMNEDGVLNSADSYLLIRKINGQS